MPPIIRIISGSVVQLRDLFFTLFVKLRCLLIKSFILNQMAIGEYFSDFSNFVNSKKKNKTPQNNQKFATLHSAYFA